MFAGLSGATSCSAQVVCDQVVCRALWVEGGVCAHTHVLGWRVFSGVYGSIAANLVGAM